jgi:hypothetical protein
MLKWVQTFCAGVRYSVKIDDDVYFNVPNLVSFLERLDESASTNLITGLKYKDSMARPNPHSKWYTPPSVWSGKFPDYVAGYFYVLGRNARVQLYNAVPKTPSFHMEDVFVTGMIRNNTEGPLEVLNMPYNYNNWPWNRNYLPSCWLYGVVVVHTLPAKTVECWMKNFGQRDFTCSIFRPINSYCP